MVKGASFYIQKRWFSKVSDGSVNNQHLNSEDKTMSKKTKKYTKKAEHHIELDAKKHGSPAM